MVEAEQEARVGLWWLRPWHAGDLVLELLQCDGDGDADHIAYLDHQEAADLAVALVAVLDAAGLDAVERASAARREEVERG